MKINLAAMLHITMMNSFGGAQRLANSEKVPSEKSQRSRQLVAKLKLNAERKRQRKNTKRLWDHDRCITHNRCLVS